MKFVSLSSGQAGAPTFVDPSDDDLAAYGGGSPDSARDLAASAWRVAYGQFMPQLGAPPLTRAKHFLKCQGATFVGFTRAREQRFAHVRRIHLFDMFTSASGRLIYFPCFVLLRTSLDIPPRKSRAPLFLHPCLTAETREMAKPIAFSVLGIFSIKAEVLKARPLLAENPDAQDWLRFASEDYASKIAREIR